MTTDNADNIAAQLQLGLSHETWLSVAEAY